MSYRNLGGKSLALLGVGLCFGVDISDLFDFALLAILHVPHQLSIIIIIIDTPPEQDKLIH